MIISIILGCSGLLKNVQCVHYSVYTAFLMRLSKLANITIRNCNVNRSAIQICTASVWPAAPTPSFRASKLCCSHTVRWTPPPSGQVARAGRPWSTAKPPASRRGRYSDRREQECIQTTPWRGSTDVAEWPNLLQAREVAFQPLGVELRQYSPHRQ